MKQLSEWIKLKDNGEKDFVLIDVREPNEYEINRIPGSVLIPKADFQTGVALEKLPQDKQLVFHCKSGVRSAEVLAIAKGAGFSDAVHVGGGVVAWVDQIDPSQPAYQKQPPQAGGVQAEGWSRFAPALWLSERHPAGGDRFSGDSVSGDGRLVVAARQGPHVAHGIHGGVSDRLAPSPAGRSRRPVR